MCILWNLDKMSHMFLQKHIGRLGGLPSQLGVTKWRHMLYQFNTLFSERQLSQLSFLSFPFSSDRARGNNGTCPQPFPQQDKKQVHHATRRLVIYKNSKFQHTVIAKSCISSIFRSLLADLLTRESEMNNLTRPTFTSKRKRKNLSLHCICNVRFTL